MNGEENTAGAGLPGSEATATSGFVTPAAIAHLRGTRPWVRLLSILGFVGVGFLVIAAVGVVGFTRLIPGTGPLGGLAVGSFYLLMAGIYVFPALFLSRYASAIRRLESARDAVSLERALEEQKKFWRLVGIITLVALGVNVLVVFFVIVAGVAGFLSR